MDPRPPRSVDLVSSTDHLGRTFVHEALDGGGKRVVITDRDTAVPDDGPSLSIVDTACGTVVCAGTEAGFVAAVWLRRVALRPHREGTVFLDVRATCVAEPVVVRAVADLADGLRTRGGVLVVVRSPRTPPMLVAAAAGPVCDSLAEAFGCPTHPSDPHATDLPTRPSDRRPPAIGGRRGTDPDRYPVPPGDPFRIRPAPLRMPHPRRSAGH